jgi:putative peptidoglycan lipid II flippase
MLLLMVPMVIGLAPVQVNLLLDALIAEAFVPGDGANSYLFYGNRLMQFPLAIVGIAMAIVVFPVFARQAKAGKRAELGNTLSTALRNTFFLALPAAAGLLVLAGPLIALIYERGAFGRGDTDRTAMVLMMYSVGIPAYCGLQILTRLFYSLEEVKTPVKVGVYMVGVNLALNLALVFPLGESGLALATALSAGLNFAVLAVIARRRLEIRGLRPVALSALRSLLLSAAMAAAVLGVSLALRSAYPDRDLVPKLLWVLPAIATGVVLYLGAAFLLRLPEASALRPGRGARPRGSHDDSS